MQHWLELLKKRYKTNNEKQNIPSTTFNEHINMEAVLESDLKAVKANANLRKTFLELFRW